MSLTQAVNRTISDLQVKIKPAKGLSIDYVLGIDNIAQEGRNLIERYPYISAQEGSWICWTCFCKYFLN
jgi:hypothetical protein